MATSTKEDEIHSEESERADARMTFTAHLGELRSRLIWSFGFLVVAVLLCYGLFSDSIITALSYPLNQMGGDSVLDEETGEMVERPAPTWTTLNPLEPILVKMKISAFAGLFLTAPFILFQIRAFIFPGLNIKERRTITFLLSGCIVLGFAGASLAYWGVFPQILPYLVKFAPAFVENQLRLNETLSLIIKGILGFALAFQFPLIVLVLVYLGILTPDSLKQYRRVAIVGIVIAGALLTPPDPVTLFLLSVPLYLLYELSIWASYFVVRRKNAADEA